MCVCVCGCVVAAWGGRRRTAQSFAHFLPDLTSRSAHLMQFQLPQTIPQPQRPQECGITVGRRGAAASRDAQSRGVRKPRPAATRRPDQLGLAVPTPPCGSVPFPVPSGKVGHRTRSTGFGTGGRGRRGTGLLPPTSPGRDAPFPLPEIHFLKK